METLSSYIWGESALDPSSALSPSSALDPSSPELASACHEALFGIPLPSAAPSLWQDIALRIRFELLNAPSYLPAPLLRFLSSVYPYPLVPFYAAFVFSLLVVFFLTPGPACIRRHCAWLLDTLWAGPAILFPSAMDHRYTPAFLREFSTAPLSSLDPNKRTVALVLVMGAQNRGCHLVYWHLLRQIRSRLEREHGVNVVVELNRWALDGPQDHADASLDHPKLRMTFIRRLLADYIGVPISHLFATAPLASVEKSVCSARGKVLSRLGADHDVTTVLLAHSLGGPICYRYLQQHPRSLVDKVLSIGAMNHFTNPVLAGAKPFHPVRVPHLDIVDAADFLAFPFYRDPDTDSALPPPDARHFTWWLSETWAPAVFAHTGYAHCESFYEAAVAFLGAEEI
ncbi:hypothetical protein TeGR_g4657 [Tetraparma gracilis]|uniref:AB hydrolase-1 domain-containing protein n=1 Tax=Tetraparma gracilis TaxID=2962635 RepID=A0ABQ6MDJ5_9STRA|nr:hypothetical protein TeGR_g4657 [Tetraparma gracilis]